jgi:hypothetical protein
MSQGDATQFSREFRMRRLEAEALRADLAQQGLDTRELDETIREMRRLENNTPFGNPQGLDQLQADVIDGLKGFEFSLFRALGLGMEKRPALEARSPVPAEYRAMVEEYYRALARDKK